MLGTGVAGVSGDRRHSGNMNPWSAHITVNGKKKHLGFFPTEEAAARAHDEAARHYHKSMAILNFVDDDCEGYYDDEVEGDDPAEEEGSDVSPGSRPAAASVAAAARDSWSVSSASSDDEQIQKLSRVIRCNSGGGRVTLYVSSEDETDTKKRPSHSGMAKSIVRENGERRIKCREGTSRYRGESKSLTH